MSISIGDRIGQNGALVTEEEFIANRNKKGQCITCDAKLFEIKQNKYNPLLKGKRIPLTLEGYVAEGRCLRCNPLPRIARPRNARRSCSSSTTNVRPVRYDVSDDFEEFIEITDARNHDEILDLVGSLFDENLSSAELSKGCDKLSNLARDEETKYYVFVCGGISALLGLMREDLITDMALQEKVGELLNKILPFGIEESLKNLDLVEKMELVMMQHKISSIVQENSMGILWYIFSTCQEMIEDFKGVDIIIGAMRDHPDSASVHEKGCVLMWTLAANPELCDEISKKGGEKVCLDALKNFQDVESVMMYAHGAIDAMYAIQEENTSV